MVSVLTSTEFISTKLFLHSTNIPEIPRIPVYIVHVQEQYKTRMYVSQPTVSPRGDDTSAVLSLTCSVGECRMTATQRAQTGKSWGTRTLLSPHRTPCTVGKGLTNQMRKILKG